MEEEKAEIVWCRICGGPSFREEDICRSCEELEKSRKERKKEEGRLKAKYPDFADSLIVCKNLEEIENEQRRKF